MKSSIFLCCLLKYKFISLYSRIRLQTNDQTTIRFVFFTFVQFCLPSFLAFNRTCYCYIFYSFEFRRFHFVLFLFLFASYVNTPENLSIWPIINSMFKLFNNAQIQKVWHIYRTRTFIHFQRTQSSLFLFLCLR